MPTLRTWDELYKSFGQFKSCDDGAVAEGFSESVARILVDHWNTLPRLYFLGTKNVAFRKFALRHIDASLDRKDLEAIKKKTTTQCPRAAQRFLCADLEKQADSALREDAEGP